MKGWRRSLHRVIFEADTPMGKAFDLGLIVAIVLSVITVILESVGSIRAKWVWELHLIEWVFTILFTLEYIMRLICLDRPMRYVFSFYGLVDLISFLPTYLSAILPGAQYFLSVRVLRVLRIFRILKLMKYVGESDLLVRAMWASSKKIVVFFSSILIMITVLGSLMYVVEGEENGFTSIPISMYWAVVTLTTVGYGDISPQTALGKSFASLVMLSGYAIIAVPTGIVTVEFSKAFRQLSPTYSCPGCGAEGHDDDALFCKKCGHELPDPKS